MEIKSELSKLSRQELESLVTELWYVLYSDLEKDWGADELANIDEAFIRKGLSPEFNRKP